MLKRLLFIFISLISGVVYSQTVDLDTLSVPKSVFSIKLVELDSLNNRSISNIDFKRSQRKVRPNKIKDRPIKVPEAQTFVLNNGLTVVLVQDEKLPLVSYKLHFNYKQALLGKKNGVNLIFSDLWGRRGKKFTRNYIEEKIDVEGARFVKDDASLYLEGLARHKESNLEVLADLAFNFTYSVSDFEESKKKIYDKLYYSSNKNDYIVERVGKSLMFGENNPIGQKYKLDYIDSIKIEDVRGYYADYFNPSNAYLVVYGDIDLRTLKRLVSRNFRNYKKKEIKSRSYSQPYNIPQLEIDFIENYSSDSLSVWFANVEYVSTYEANWIFNGISRELLFNKKEGFFYKGLVSPKTISALDYEIDIKDKYFSVMYNVAQDSLVTSLVKSVDYLNNVINPKVDTAKFRLIKNIMHQNYIRGLYDPLIVSNYYLEYYLTGQDRYLIPNLMAFMDTLNYKEISNSLKEIIKPQQMRIVISGPPQIVVPQLERLGIPINYYDQLGNETFPPSLDKPVSDSIKVDYVMSRYRKAIGGIDRLDDISKILQWWELRVGKMELVLKSKYMLPHRRISTYSNREVIVLKTVFDGKSGYTETEGVKKEVKGMEYARQATEKSVFPEIYYLEDGYKVDIISQIPIKGENCYKLRFEAPFGDVFRLYFRIEDGYIVRKEVLDPITNEVVNYFAYSDFKNFENVVMPYNVETTIAGRKVTMNLKKVTFNDKNVKKRNFQ